MHFSYQITGGDFTHAGYASSQVKQIMKQLNVDPVVIKRIVIALYEAEVNVVAHAYRGNIDIDIEPECISAVVNDEGPGIADIELAMQEGYSTASSKVREMGFGAGMGLSNMKKNSDKLIIQSQPDKGTRVEITTFLIK